MVPPSSPSYKDALLKPYHNDVVVNGESLSLELLGDVTEERDLEVLKDLDAFEDTGV